MLRHVPPFCAYPSAHFYYANYLVALGRYEEAIAEAKKALALDPVSMAAQTNVAIIYLRAGRYDQAVEEARRVLDLDTTYAHAYYVLGRAYVQKGMYREAILSSRRAVALEGSNVRYLASLAHTYGVAGKRSNASELLDQIKRIMVQRQVPAYALAICYAALGKKDETLAWLTKEIQCNNWRKDQNDSALFSPRVLRRATKRPRVWLPV